MSRTSDHKADRSLDHGIGAEAPGPDAPDHVISSHFVTTAAACTPGRLPAPIKINLAAAGIAVAVILTGCRSGAPTQSAASTTPSQAATATPTATTSSPVSGAGSETAGHHGPKRTGSVGAVDLPVSATDRTALVAAGAKMANLPASDYLGLRPGLTYLARDRRTGTFWAAAALQPRPSSLPAKVSVQDAGSYLIFYRPTGGSWRATTAGFPATAATCAATGLPADVIKAWGWAPQTCHPRGPRTA